MKIKSVPEDFKVEERILLPLTRDGAYGLYRLWKRDLSTLEALQKLALAATVPLEALGYGGKKDRHGETVQFVTVKKAQDISFTEKNLRCFLVGHVAHPMRPKWVEGNSFRLVLRDFASEEEALALISTVRQDFLPPMPNYYDDQRFGGHGKDDAFMGEALLLQNPSEVLRLYFCRVHPRAPGRVRRRVTMISRHWGDWRKVYPFCHSKKEKEILAMLRRDDSPRGLWKGVNKLPREVLGMEISAFQSYLWNRLLGKYLCKVGHTEEFQTISCGAWDFPWFPLVARERNLIVPIASYSKDLPEMDSFWEGLWKEVLQERGIRAETFSIPELTQAYFGSFFRDSHVFAEKISAQASCEDEVWQVVLSFDLPRGSYATLFIKHLMLLGKIVQKKMSF